MILDEISNAKRYEVLGQRISKALMILEDASIYTAKVGKYEVDGENLFYLVQEYETQRVQEGKLEIHRKYMDIHSVLSGMECIYSAQLEELIEVLAYDDDKDVALFQNDQLMNKITLKQGMFMMFWPNEPHLPCRIVSQSERVKKIVIKIRME